jgi:hypothetical protein
MQRRVQSDYAAPVSRLTFAADDDDPEGPVTPMGQLIFPMPGRQRCAEFCAVLLTTQDVGANDDDLSGLDKRAVSTFRRIESDWVTQDIGERQAWQRTSMTRPHVVLSIVGGEQQVDKSWPLQAFSEDLRRMAERNSCWVVTSGMNVGITAHVGAILPIGLSSTPIIGVASLSSDAALRRTLMTKLSAYREGMRLAHEHSQSSKRVSPKKRYSAEGGYASNVKAEPPGGSESTSDEAKQKRKLELEVNHSHFVLVEGPANGGEIEATRKLRVALETVIRNEMGSQIVYIVCEGGADAITATLLALRSRFLFVHIE